MNAGERRVARWYRLRGWRVLAANVHVGHEELDLIVRRGRSLRFVEVKEKRGGGFGDPFEMADARKLAHVRRAATGWLVAHPELAGLDPGLDVVGVTPAGIRRLRVSPLDGDD